MNTSIFNNLFWRIVIFLTILLIGYIFFRQPPNDLAGQIQQTAALNDQYSIFFLNPNRDSLLITGKLDKIDKQIFVKGQIKSLSKFKIQNVDIEFSYYSEKNIRLGKETLSIQKEFPQKSVVDFKKEGLTIPDDTKEIRIRILDQIKNRGYTPMN